jgi:predicted RNase H-like nuclease (RuvC/YqgF family)
MTPLPLVDQPWPRRGRRLAKLYRRCFRLDQRVREQEAEIARLRKALADTIRERDAARLEFRFADRAIQDLADQYAKRTDALEAKIEAVRALHFSVHQKFCHGCAYGWPCPTIRALGGES